MELLAEDPLAAAVTAAIQTGDVEALSTMLRSQPHLVTARIRNDGSARTLLHVVTDWPGHFPNGIDTVRPLVRRAQT